MVKRWNLEGNQGGIQLKKAVLKEERKGNGKSGLVLETGGFVYYKRTDTQGSPTHRTSEKSLTRSHSSFG